MVTLFRRVWIEILISVPGMATNVVTLFRRVWIEIVKDIGVGFKTKRHPL